MGRSARIAIGAVALLGIAAAIFFRSGPPPEETAAPVERKTQPKREVELGEAPPAPVHAAVPSGGPNFVVQILAPNGGAPGSCWLELQNPTGSVSGAIENGREEGAFVPGPLTVFAFCVEGHARATLNVPDLAAKLTLEPNAILSVDVHWSDGRPAAGVEVIAEVQQPTSPWFTRFVERNPRRQLQLVRRLTTAEGHVELAFPPAMVKVSASDGRTAKYAEGNDPRGAAQTAIEETPSAGLESVAQNVDLRTEPIQHLQLVLPVGRALSGTVVDEQKKPVAGLTLTAVNAELAAGKNRGQQVAVTDGSGRFFFNAGIPTTVNLTGDGVTAVVTSGAAPVQLVQRQARWVDGKVISRDGGVPAGVVVDETQAVHADGTFSFETERWEDHHTFEFWARPSSARKLLTVDLTPGMNHLGEVILDP